MKTLSRMMLCMGIVAGLAGAAAAAEISGILMDKMCAPTAIKGGQDVAMKHARTCNLTANCSKSGYGVFTADNKYISLDEAGNAMALKALKASTKKDDMKVTVNGTLEGDTIKVTDLKLAE